MCIHEFFCLKIIYIFVASGLTADMSRLHLMHGDPLAQTWTDVTSQVSLQLTHLYAVFYINHFSWYASFIFYGSFWNW